MEVEDCLSSMAARPNTAKRHEGVKKEYSKFGVKLRSGGARMMK